MNVPAILFLGIIFLIVGHYNVYAIKPTGSYQREF